MRRRRPDCDPEGEPRGGFSGFLRSLFDGIPWIERAEERETLHFEAPAGGSLRLHNSNGRTRVCGEDRDDIEVLMEKVARAESREAAVDLAREIRLASSEVDTALELEVVAPSRWSRRGHAHLTLRVPRALSVDLSAANGRLSVEGLRGSLRARSSNGSVCLVDVEGDIEVATSNAKVSSARTCGRLVARSSNGKIEMEQHRGSVDASTSNGLIRASLEKVGKQGVQLATSNGRIVLELPAQVDADVDIRVDNGFVRNDRSLEEVTRETNGRVRGRLGSGGPLIKLRTSNGSVVLR